jgi:hypothetical protein
VFRELVRVEALSVSVWLRFVDLNVAQTSRLRLRTCRSAKVEKQPGQDGSCENLALCSSPNIPESAFPERLGAGTS